MQDIKIHCVGMRDGLQMENDVVGSEKKLEWIDKLCAAGVDVVQVGSFVHKVKMPQMADTDELFKILNSRPRASKTIFSGLILNEKGLDRALDCGVDLLCLGVSASDTHSRKNTGMGAEEAADKIVELAKRCISSGKKIQASIQSAFGCGFEGDIAESRVMSIVDKYLDAGVELISLADTAGFANPEQVNRLYSQILNKAPNVKLACHFHNTYGMGMANCYAAYKAGVQYFESAFGGLGGCPFTKKAAGNVPTEDLVEMFQNFGLIPHISMERLINLAQDASNYFDRQLPGYVYKTGRIKH
jgi:hydroxymethylglutaryl-CoA lyase